MAEPTNDRPRRQVPPEIRAQLVAALAQALAAAYRRERQKRSDEGRDDAERLQGQGQG